MMANCGLNKKRNHRRRQAVAGQGKYHRLHQFRGATNKIKQPHSPASLVQKPQVQKKKNKKKTKKKTTTKQLNVIHVRKAIASCTLIYCITTQKKNTFCLQVQLDFEWTQVHRQDWSYNNIPGEGWHYFSLASHRPELWGGGGEAQPRFLLISKIKINY